MADFLPRQDYELMIWAKGFVGAVQVDPARFGLTGDAVAELAAAFEMFAEALSATLNPQTRTAVAVLRKNRARQALEAVLRPAARTVRGMVRLSGEELINLGLRPREAGRRRVPAPTEAPLLSLRAMDGCMLRVELRGRHTDRRGKPAQVAAAAIYTHVGEQPPEDASQWTRAAITTSPRCVVPFEVGLRPGTQVWVMACWLSPTTQPGPMSEPVYAYLTGGLRFGELRSAA
jgi:hypothetical protein